MKTLRNCILLIFIVQLTFILTINCYGQVNGNAYLSGQTDHSGIKVKFIPNSITAQKDSTFSNTNGSYSINLSGGLYQVLYSKSGYQDIYYNKGNIVAIATSDKLSDITLLKGIAIYVTGNVSGTWTSNNIYIINSDITIPNNNTLKINPGTMVKFNGDYSIIANGTLLAFGSESPIIFTSNFSKPAEGNWNKIEINNSTSRISHCIIEYCKYAFYFSDYSPTISNNIIRNISEGGIYCLNGSPLITGNTIYNFNIQTFSWGIWVEGYNSKSTIECNTIFNGSGRGISTKSNNIVRNNIIYNISNPYSGVGIRVSNECHTLIENNYVHDCRIGIDIANSVSDIPDPLIVNNTIINNSDAGIYFHDFYAKGTVINNIIISNGYGIKQDVPDCAPLCSTTPEVVAHNLVWNNTNGNFYTVQIAGIGKIVTTNSNGDPIDPYFNLTQNPLFVSNTPPIISSNSPCVNAGDSIYAYNLGFDTHFICQQTSQTINEKMKINNEINVECSPNPFSEIINIIYSVPFDTYVDIKIIDLFGRLQIQILNDYKIKGEYNFNFNGKNIQPGIYFMILTTKDNKRASKIIVKY